MASLSSKKLIWTLASSFVVIVAVTVILAKSFAPSTMLIIGDSSKPVNTSWFGVAIKGYDTVAYFTENRAVKGKSEFSYEWNDAKWRFASASNRDRFAENPQRFAPQYGGYWATSIVAGEFVSVNPEAWKIVDGKLYLSFSKAGRNQFHNNAAENIKKADEMWSGMRTQN